MFDARTLLVKGGGGRPNFSGSDHTTSQRSRSSARTTDDDSLDVFTAMSSSEDSITLTRENLGAFAETRIDELRVSDVAHLLELYKRLFAQYLIIEQQQQKRQGGGEEEVQESSDTNQRGGGYSPSSLPPSDSRSGVDQRASLI
jgi:hypothetical protein